MFFIYDKSAIPGNKNSRGRFPIGSAQIAALAILTPELLFVFCDFFIIHFYEQRFLQINSKFSFTQMLH